MEKNIHKFILHVVNNLFPLNEYQEGEIKILMDKFKEEADDLNIEITDAELRKYIERFDQLKDSSKVEDKVLRNYPLPKLIKLVTSSAGAEVEEETGPDVIYSENDITVYSGGSEELCQRHRSDVPWCIAKSAFGNYRYSKDRKFPSFYLIKNDSPEYINDRKLAFVAIQVKDTSNESEKYVWTPKDNSPNESKQMSWSELTSAIPWLNSIPNVKNMLKYVPLSTTEKATNIFSKTAISIRQWMSLPFTVKKQYLVVRKEEKDLFNDISKDEFTANYLPKYPQLASFIATTSGILPSTLLLKNLDKFSVNDRKSITANLQQNIYISELSKDTIPFDVKKLLVTLKKWDLDLDERMYITKNGEAIIKLTFTSGDVQVGVFTEKDDYPNIKLNARTSKYLLDYPDIDKIPFNVLIKLTNNEVIDKSFIEKIIVKAQEDPNSAIVVKDVEDGKILLDSNSFTSYKIKDGKISSIPFDSEEVQNILNNETENTGFQDSAVNVAFNKKNISSSIDKDSFLNLLKNTSYNKRTREGQVILVNSESDGNAIFGMSSTAIASSPDSEFAYGGQDWRNYQGTRNSVRPENWKVYFDYLRSKDIGFTDQQLENYANRNFYQDSVKKFIAANPPMATNSTYLPVVIEDQYVLLNKQNPQDSKRIGKNKLIRASISPAVARGILGGAAPATPTVTTPRAPRAQAAPVAPAAGANAAVDNIINDAGLTNGFNSLPTSIKGRIRGGTRTTYNRRNAAVDAIGTVQTLIQNGSCKFYIIRLNSGTIIGFVTQNLPLQIYHAIVTTTRAYSVPRVGELSNVIRTNNLSEGTKTVLRVHAAAYPKETNEIKKILQKLKIEKNETRRIKKTY